MSRQAVMSVLLLLMGLACAKAYPASSHHHPKETDYRIMLADDGSKSYASAISQALLKGDTTAGAAAIAEATTAGDVASVASALAVALAQDKSTVAAQALTQAISQGSSSDVLARAASDALSGSQDAPKQELANAIQNKDPAAVADKLDKGYQSSVRSVAISSSGATATATAYVDFLAAVSGPCAACGSKRLAPGSDKESQPSPKPSPDSRKEPTHDDRKAPADDNRKGHKDAGDDDVREQHDKYSSCHPWLKDDCCAGWKGASHCQCFGFGLRGVGSNDVCKYRLLEATNKGRRVWEDRWSKKRCQCDA